MPGGAAGATPIFPGAGFRLPIWLHHAISGQRLPI